jgi:HEAT repeat protein
MLFLFGDPNKYVRFLAESALARTWRSTSCRSYLLQELETAMSDPRWTVRFGALGVMEEAEIRDGRATAAMIASLRDAHPLIRQRAAFMLGKFDVAEAIPHLAPATSDLDERFRCLAAQSLGWIGGDEMSVGASFSEEHEDQVIVVSSVRSIGRRPENPEAVPAIVALLGFMEDTSPKVRKQVLDSLPGIETGLTAMHKATPEAQPALDRLRKLAARTDAVGQTARDALMLIDASGETDDAPDSQP